ncbi:hypothetical protein H4R33_004040, partial [Dimargaris cristalligena]
MGGTRILYLLEISREYLLSIQTIRRAQPHSPLLSRFNRKCYRTLVYAFYHAVHELAQLVERCECIDANQPFLVSGHASPSFASAVVVPSSLPPPTTSGPKQVTIISPHRLSRSAQSSQSSQPFALPTHRTAAPPLTYPAPGNPGFTGYPGQSGPAMPLRPSIKHTYESVVPRALYPSLAQVKELLDTAQLLMHDVCSRTVPGAFPPVTNITVGQPVAHHIIDSDEEMDDVVVSNPNPNTNTTSNIAPPSTAPTAPSTTRNSVPTAAGNEAIIIIDSEAEKDDSLPDYSDSSESDVEVIRIDFSTLTARSADLRRQEQTTSLTTPVISSNLQVPPPGLPSSVLSSSSSSSLPSASTLPKVQELRISPASSDNKPALTRVTPLAFDLLSLVRDEAQAAPTHDHLIRSVGKNPAVAERPEWYTQNFVQASAKSLAVYRPANTK